MPIAVASSAAARAVRSARSASKAEASPRGTGNTVFSPWITSAANTSGIFNREDSTVIFCSARAVHADADAVEQAGDLAGLFLQCHLADQRLDEGIARRLIVQGLRDSPGDRGWNQCGGSKRGGGEGASLQQPTATEIGRRVHARILKVRPFRKLRSNWSPQAR